MASSFVFGSSILNVPPRVRLRWMTSPAALLEDRFEPPHGQRDGAIIHANLHALYSFQS